MTGSRVLGPSRTLTHSLCDNPSPDSRLPSPDSRLPAPDPDRHSGPRNQSQHRLQLVPTPQDVN